MDVLRRLGMQRVVLGVRTVNAVSQACLVLFTVCQKSNKRHVHMLPSRVLGSWLPLNHQRLTSVSGWRGQRLKISGLFVATVQGGSVGKHTRCRHKSSGKEEVLHDSRCSWLE